MIDLENICEDIFVSRNFFNVDEVKKIRLNLKEKYLNCRWKNTKLVYPHQKNFNQLWLKKYLKIISIRHYDSKYNFTS
ncbi:hypothetical protein OAL56_00535 [Candidatus Pelagibacter sp.]|nr:hypothetical protein [Candidatus Pelagibacter sp.]